MVNNFINELTPATPVAADYLCFQDLDNLTDTFRSTIATILAISHTHIKSQITDFAHNVLDSTYHSDVLTGSITRGDILYGNSTPKIARLAKGSTGQVLQADATDVLFGFVVDANIGTHTTTKITTTSKSLLNSAIVYNDQANTYDAGFKQTFTPDATNSGINIGSFAGNPSAPADADIWYNSSTGRARLRIAGVSSAIATQVSVDVYTNKTLDVEDATNVLKQTTPTLGELLVDNGTKFVSKTKGTALQVLRVNAGGTDLEYADPAAGSVNLTWKNSVRVATTAAQTLATDFENGDTIDGIVLATGNRILIKNQATGSENGIYTVNASGAPTRATDYDSGADLISNSCVFVQEGTANLDKCFQCTTNETITIGTTALVFAEFGAGGGSPHAILDGSTHNDSVAQAVIRGSLIYGNATPKWDELVIGTASKRIRSDGTDASWAWESLTAQNSTVTLTDNMEVISCNAGTTACTLTLPSASGRTGKHYRIINNTGTGLPISIAPDGTDTINNGTAGSAIILEEQFQTVDLYCGTGTNWFTSYSDIYRDPDLVWYKHWDFDTVQDSSGLIDGWLFTENGTGTVLQIDGIANHPGIVQLTTGATSGNDENIHTGGSTTLNTIVMNATYSIIYLIRIPTITSVGVRIGLGNTSAYDTLTGANQFTVFQFDPAVNAAWQVTNNDATTAVTTTSGVTVTANQWYKLKIVRNGANLYYYIDNVFVAQHTTVLPSAAGNLVCTVQTNTTAARTLQVDYVRMNCRLVR